MRTGGIFALGIGLVSLGAAHGGTVEQKAFEIPTKYPLSTDKPECPPNNALPRPRVAIIGAGASGSSAAYFLSKAREQLIRDGIPGCNAEEIPNDVQITVFERNSRVGGRVLAIHPLDDKRYSPIDIGASVFSNINSNLVSAAQKYKLQRTKHDPVMQSPIGLWDGVEFVIDDFDNSRWSQWKLYWRYGNGPQKVLNLYVFDSRRVGKTIQSFRKIYSPQFLHDPKGRAGYPWPSIADLAQSLGINPLISQGAPGFFEGHKVPELCVNELVNAATRGNYAQNVNGIHAFASLVSMAANGASGIEGGNAQIFEHMLNDSNATVQQGVSGDVTGIMKVQTESLPHVPSTTRWRVGTRDGHSDIFDAVLIATPWHNSHITLLNTEKSVPNFQFQRLVATLVVTDAVQPNPKYFGYDSSFQRVPRVIVTSSGKDQDKEPEFLSLSYLRILPNAHYMGRQWDKLYLVKLFSRSPLSPQTLEKMFGNGEIVWTHEKVWPAFPVLSPTESLHDFEVDSNLYNINAMERAISTMETSTVAAKNVVGLILQKWLGTRFIHGWRCKWTSRPPNAIPQWDTWGCLSS